MTILSTTELAHRFHAVHTSRRVQCCLSVLVGGEFVALVEEVGEEGDVDCFSKRLAARPNGRMVPNVVGFPLKWFTMILGWVGSKEGPLFDGWTTTTTPANSGRLRVTAFDQLQEHNLLKSPFERIRCAFPSVGSIQTRSSDSIPHRTNLLYQTLRHTCILLSTYNTRCCQ
jgi:hypothetical protein